MFNKKYFSKIHNNNTTCWKMNAYVVESWDDDDTNQVVRENVLLFLIIAWNNLDLIKKYDFKNH